MLQKQAIDISFAQGLDTKSDPFRVPVGKFLSLVNTVFDDNGLIKKRNGFGLLNPFTVSGSYISAPDAQQIEIPRSLATYNDSLIAISNNLFVFSRETGSWLEKGFLLPIQIDTLPLIHSATNQTQSDTAIAPNGLIGAVYTDTQTGTNKYYAAIFDSSGNVLFNPFEITDADSALGTPKIFSLAGYFVVVYTELTAATYSLKYFAISTETFNYTGYTTISSLYTPDAAVAWDGIVTSGNLYLAWNGSDMGGSIHINYLDPSLVLHTPVVVSGKVATNVSICVDETRPVPQLYISIYDSGSSDGYTMSYTTNMDEVFSSRQIATSVDLANITSCATDSVCYVFQEVNNNYGFDSNIPSNYVRYRTVTTDGTVGTLHTILRSVGLASKAFILENYPYFLCTYGSQSAGAYSSLQPTYFLSNLVGQIIGKLAYSNGGGYLTTGLPSVTVIDNVASVSYLVKDLVQGINKSLNADTSTGVYSQLGVNLAYFSIVTDNIVTVESAQVLHTAGGFVWMYDGLYPVEHGFFLWPENIGATGSGTAGSMDDQPYYYQVTYEWADLEGNVYRSAPSIPLAFTLLTPSGTFTANRTSGSATLASVSSFTNLQVGQGITGTGIPASTYILSMNVGANTITMSHNASSGSATATTVTAAAATSASLNIPTLRLTYKGSSNPVKIVVYRWSAAQPVFYQTTSITVPTLNSLSSDYITFTDTHSDAQIIGNNILYTTGGVLENIAAPAFDSMDLFDNRVWGIDSEDKNLLWFSKQVIENTPVEFSDLLTFFVSPTTGAQASTGDMKCLSPLDDKQIIFKSNAIYFINGTGPDNTGSNNQYPQPIFITSSVGCENQASVVFMPNGLMFQASGGKGIWLLARNMQTSYVGADVEAFNNNRVVSSVCVPGTNEVRFILDNGTCLMYDYFYGQWSVFKTISATSSVIYSDLHTYVNNSGTIFQETPGQYLDNAIPVTMAFTTSWIKLAGLQGYQRAYLLNFLGTYYSPHKLSVSIAYDYNSSVLQNVLIAPTNATWMYGNATPYGSDSPYGGAGNIEQWKINLIKQRSQSFQISVQEIWDPAYGLAAGPGLTLSGVNCVVGVKKAYVPMRATQTTG